MHERIKLISDTEVDLYRNGHPDCVTRFVIGSDGFLRIQYANRHRTDGLWDYDALGNEAEILVRQCYRDTGSFSALADTSAVPFAGKRMRVRVGGEIRECIVYDKYLAAPGFWKVGIREVGVYTTDILLPLTDLPERKKYRPYKPEEFLRLVPVLATTEGGTTCVFTSVQRDGAIASGGSFACFETLLKKYKDDAGEPCGMEVTE